MRKFFTIAFPVLTILIFIVVMLSGSYLKKPLGNGDDIPGIIESIIKDIRNEKWEAAAKKTERLGEAWRKVTARVQFSAERDEINSLSISVVRIRGAILAKDKGIGLSELMEASEHWYDLAQ